MTTKAEQRLFCWKVAHSIVQMDLTLSIHEVGNNLFRWCESESDPKLAFRCLETAYEHRGGALTTDRLLTKAKDAYTFSSTSLSWAASQSSSSTGSSPSPTKKKTRGPGKRKGVQRVAEDHFR